MKDSMNQDLIKSAQKGNMQAFSEIVQSYSAFLMAVISPILRDNTSAEDVLQETFIQVYSSLQNYHGGSFKHWLAKIATNKALDYKRKEKRKTLEIPLEELEENLEGSETTEERIMKRETAIQLKEICQQLPQEYKKAFIGFYFQGKSYEIIAAEENVSKKTIESRLYRARKIIREKWKGD